MSACHSGHPRKTPLLTRQSGYGFTLLELLVVMALLSLLMIGLISAMRTMAQTETRIDQRLQRLDDLQTIRGFLSQTLSRVSNTKLDAPEAVGKSIVPFVATPDNITWVGALPARPGAGGRRYFRLAIENDDAQQALVLRIAPCGPDLEPPNWALAESHLLLHGVSKLNVFAQGQPPANDATLKIWPRGWQSGWPVPDRLPEQVRLTIGDATQQELASWTFALHPFAQGDDTISTVTVGGATP
jgi:general secretion pathway protein J